MGTFKYSAKTAIVFFQGKTNELDSRGKEVVLGEPWLRNIFCLTRPRNSSPMPRNPEGIGTIKINLAGKV